MTHLASRRTACLVCVLVAAVLVACTQTPARIAPGVAGADQSSRQVMIMLHSQARFALRPFDYGGAGYTTGRARTVALRMAARLARDHGIGIVDDWAMPALDVHCIVAQLGAEQDVSQVLAGLSGESDIAWAQPMARFRALGAAGPRVAAEVAPGWGDLGALHRVATGRGVKIAQIDTGVDLHHPMLEGQWSDPRNFVDGGGFLAELHGTAVAGVMVARADRNTGLVGVAPGARMLPLRACWETGADGAACTSFTLAKSLQYALRQNPRVINLSITGPHDRLLERLIDRAFDQGVVVVAAADEMGTGAGFPASHPRVLAVFGNASASAGRPGLQAPSEEILTTAPNGTFAFMSGASFAAAHVTGLTALLLERSPRLTPAQVEAVLQSTAAVQDRSSRLVRVDPCAALTALIPHIQTPCAPAQSSTSTIRWEQ